MSTERHFTASAIVFDRLFNHVLLIEHRASGFWQFPGGHVDAGESANEAALREVWEETAVRATLIFPYGVPVYIPANMDLLPTPWTVLEIPAPAKPARPGKPAEEPHSHIDFLFLAVADNELTLIPAEQEVHGAAWFHFRELRRIGCRADIAPLVRAALMDLSTYLRKEGIR